MAHYSAARHAVTPRTGFGRKIAMRTPSSALPTASTASTRPSAGGRVVLPVHRPRRVRRRGVALCVRCRLDRGAGIGALRAGGAVHARRRLDAADRRACARRHLLCAGEAAHRRRSSICSARSSSCCRLPTVLGAPFDSLCGAFVGHSRALARSERPAVRLSAQDAHSGVCRSHRPAGCRASDPRRARSDRAARSAVR